MLTPSIGFALLLSAGIAECRSIFDANQHFHGRFKRQNDPNGLFLLASAVQSGSAADGSNDGVSAPGQSKSLTSTDNFINFCKGKTLTNGLQVQGGSCNGIPMGDIPSKSNMVSSIITFPEPASSNIVESTTFQISVQMINFVAGSFTNAQKTYYSAPQALSGGKIVGHTHVTVQDMGSDLNPKQPLNPEVFVFFKGINDVGNGNGLLSATVTGGLPAGNYRVCTLASASNHQLVLMPVAQRGAQDDCTKFTVVPAGGGNGNGNGGNGGGNGGQGAQSSSELSVAASQTSASETTSILSTTLVLTTSSPPPFANTSFVASQTATTTRGRGRGGKSRTTRRNTGTKAAGGGNKATSISLTTTALSTAAVEAVSTTSALAQATTTKASTTKVANNNGGKATAKPPNNVGGVKNNNNNNNNNNNRPNKVKKTKVIKIVHRVTIIRTIFVFLDSLGGLPPAVMPKKGSNGGNNFAVGNNIFADLPSACQAACGEQFARCVSFKGPGFEGEKCEIQRKQCGKAAEVVVSQPIKTPEVVTATVTVPAPAEGETGSSSSISLPGTVVADVTVTSTVEVTPTASATTGVAEQEAAPVQTGGAAVPPPPPAAATTEALSAAPLSTCPPIYKTVTVDAPVQTVTVSVSATASDTASALPTIVPSPPFVNATIPRRKAMV